jgi:hypothetical protein
VDAHQLRRLAAEVDDEHRESMRTFAVELNDTFAGPSRRRALVGTVLGAGALLMTASRAAAATTTTTAPPRQPDDADLVILAFAQSLELAAVAAYDIALSGGKLDATVSPVAALFRSHHLEHAQAMAGAAGKAARNKANQAIVKKFGPTFGSAKSQGEVLLAAFNLENAAAATYERALESLKATDSAATVAAIAPVEARHATVLARVLGMNPVDYLVPIGGGSALALSASNYAIEG